MHSHTIMNSGFWTVDWYQCRWYRSPLGQKMMCPRFPEKLPEEVVHNASAHLKWARTQRRCAWLFACLHLLMQQQTAFIDNGLRGFSSPCCLMIQRSAPINIYFCFVFFMCRFLPVISLIFKELRLSGIAHFHTQSYYCCAADSNEHLCVNIHSQPDGYRLCIYICAGRCRHVRTLIFFSFFSCSLF